MAPHAHEVENVVCLYLCDLVSSSVSLKLDHLAMHLFPVTYFILLIVLFGAAARVRRRGFAATRVAKPVCEALVTVAADEWNWMCASERESSRIAPRKPRAACLTAYHNADFHAHQSARRTPL